MNIYSFRERLAFSKGQRQKTDLDTVKSMIDGCESVTVASVEQDRTGIDYIATLRGGADIYIDAKCRDAGCSRYWRSGPELALEDWSAIPENGNHGKAGWTLDESKLTELVLFTFDPSDTGDCFLVSFQLLRIAFRRNWKKWMAAYRDARQGNSSWTSHCVFVPASVVLDAVADVSRGQQVLTGARPGMTTPEWGA